MPIGTSDGESFKDEMSWLVGQHENLSQVADKKPMVDPYGSDRTRGVEPPSDPLAPLFDPFLRTESDVPIRNPGGFDQEFRMPARDSKLKMQPDTGQVLPQPSDEPYTGRRERGGFQDRRDRLDPTELSRIMADDEVGSGKVIRPQFGGSSGGTAPQGPAKVISKGDLEHQRILKENEQSLQRSLKRFDEASKPQQYSTDEIIKLYKDNPKALKQALGERGINTDKEIIRLDKDGKFMGTRPKEGSQINDPYRDAQAEQSWNKLVKEQGKSPLFQEGSPYSKLTPEQQDSWFKHIKDPDVRKKLGIPTVREVPK